MCSQLSIRAFWSCWIAYLMSWWGIVLAFCCFPNLNEWMNEMNEWNVYWVILYYKLKTRKLPKWPIPNVQIPTPFRIIFGLHSRSDQLYNAYCNTHSIRMLTCTVVIPVKSVFAEINQYALRPPPPLTFLPPLHTSVCSFSPSTSKCEGKKVGGQFLFPSW